MNVKVLILFLVFISLIYSNSNQTIDGVAAIIEEHIVLKSDLAQMLNMSIIQNKIDPIQNVEKIKVLEKSIKIVGLNDLINIYPDMLKGSLPNKIVVDVNK